MIQPSGHFDRLRLRHLRLLELIDQQRSLRAVGQILNLTQPAVSQMVKDLEFAFDVPLVDRSVRGVALTRQGRQALQRIRAGLATFDHIAAELRAEQPATLRIGSNPALAFEILPRALQQLGAAEPAGRFKVRTGVVGDMLHALWDGELDCYVGRIDWDQIPQSLAAGLCHRPLMQTDLVLACSTAHPLAASKQLRAQDLVDWPWALPPRESNNLVALETALRNLGYTVPVPTVEISNDPYALISLVKQMNLLVCVAKIVLETDFATDTIRVLDVPDLSLPPVQIGYVTLAEHEHLEPLQALGEALADAVAKSVNRSI